MSYKERSVNFTANEVRAISAGTMTQFRRLLRECNAVEDGYHCPYGKPGDRLWVRETWAALGNEDGLPVNDKDEVIEWGPGVACIYRADTVPGKYGADVLPNGDQWFEKWRPSIHMPRWASRFALQITGVRVQRLQNISEDDAQKNGAPAIPRKDGSDPRYYRQSFAALWDSTAPTGRNWQDNPWVWVINFQRI